LRQPGYDPGPYGSIEDERLKYAIAKVQKETGWAATGEPSHSLGVFLTMRLAGAEMQTPSGLPHHEN
jgi:hypothetical protein